MAILRMVHFVVGATLLLASSSTTNGFVVGSSSSLSHGVETPIRSSTALASSPFDVFTNIFSPKEMDTPPPPTLPPVVIQPSYKLGIIFSVLGVALDTIPYIQLTLGPFVTLLGILFLVQTTRIRFVFEEETFSLKIGDQLEQSGENVVVGGENSWRYDSFVNWEFFPKGWIDSPQGPILAYFKETQTPSDKWDEGPGKSANSDEALARGAVPGQVHFFPILCDAQQLRDEFMKRKCAKL